MQLNPEFSSGSWIHDSPQLFVDITFDAVMDTSVLPADASWQVEADSVGLSETVLTWLDSSTLRILNFLPSPPTTSVTVELLVEDSNLHALAGRNVLPFGPETIPAA